MKKRHFKSTIVFLALLYFGSFSGCKKFVEIPAPKNQIVSETAFADNATAIATLNGIYSKMMGTSTYLTASSLTIYAGMSADELSYFTSSTRDEFLLNQLSNANNLVVESYFWNAAYALIYEANSCIEGAKQSQSLSQDTKDMVTGEALFVRSLMNFYLVNLFKNVPVILTTDYNENKDIGQSPPQAVFDQIKSDLLQSVQLLKDTYPSTGKARPNKAAAQAFLARVYLYLKDYDNAGLEAEAVIGSNKYQLVTDLNNVFLAGSNEAIWQLAPVTPNYNTWDANNFVPSSATAVPTYVIPPNFYDDFEAGDKRRTNWIGTRTYLGKTLYYPNKYKVRTGATTVTEYNMVLRLAEVYLIRAEVKAMKSDLAGARTDLNLIRTRAGLGAIDPSSTQATILAAILKERKRELFLEWGQRWFDLKRTGTIDAVLGALKPTWKPAAAYYPIPYTQILINTKLVQNEGY